MEAIWAVGTGGVLHDDLASAVNQFRKIVTTAYCVHEAQPTNEISTYCSIILMRKAVLSRSCVLIDLPAPKQKKE